MGERSAGILILATDRNSRRALSLTIPVGPELLEGFLNPGTLATLVSRYISVSYSYLPSRQGKRSQLRAGALTYLCLQSRVLEFPSPPTLTPVPDPRPRPPLVFLLPTSAVNPHGPIPPIGILLSPWALPPPSGLPPSFNLPPFPSTPLAPEGPADHTGDSGIPDPDLHGGRITMQSHHLRVRSLRVSAHCRLQTRLHTGHGTRKKPTPMQRKQSKNGTSLIPPHSMKHFSTCTRCGRPPPKGRSFSYPYSVLVDG